MHPRRCACELAQEKRCGKPIDERRLEALPTARYDAACQAAIEQSRGEGDRPTL